MNAHPSSLSDRELLELAAKAAGLTVAKWADGGPMHLGPVAIIVQEDGLTYGWRPLTDDGDALRLAVKLRISLDHEDCDCCVYAYPRDRDGLLQGDEVVSERLHEAGSDDELQTRAEATRRAIVRVAAALASPK